jgi:hypothetical protein
MREEHGAGKALFETAHAAGLMIVRPAD